MNKFSLRTSPSRLALVSLALSSLWSMAAAQTCATCAAPAPTNLLAQARATPATATPVALPADLKLPTAATGDQGTSTCCPLAMTGPFKNYFAYDQLPGKNVGSSYGLKFLTTFNYPSPVVDGIPQTLALDQQMYPFAFYAGSVGSGLVTPGYTANSLLLLAEIREVQPPSTLTDPTTTTWNSPYALSHLTSNGSHAIRAWWAGIPAPAANPYNVWDGSSPNFFHTAYMDGFPLLSPNGLLPNRYYMMKISLVLAEYRQGDPWHIKEITCNNFKQRYFWWNLKEGTLKTTGGTPALQFNEVK